MDWIDWISIFLKSQRGGEEKGRRGGEGRCKAELILNTDWDNRAITLWISAHFPGTVPLVLNKPSLWLCHRFPFLYFFPILTKNWLNGNFYFIFLLKINEINDLASFSGDEGFSLGSGWSVKVTNKRFFIFLLLLYFIKIKM